MACHFESCKAALFFFIKTLESIRTQTRKPDCAVISWSCSPCSLELCDRLWKQFRNKYDSDVWVDLYSDHQQYQFQHYERVSEYITTHLEGNAAEKWYLIFGDSDDVWQDTRIQYMMERASGYCGSNSVFVFNWKKAVDGVTEVTRIHLDEFEYWMCMIGSEVFHAFFQTMVDRRYLATLWTDLAFDRHLLAYSPKYFTKQPTDPWLYHYCGSNSSKHRGFTDENLRLVEHIKQRLMELYPEPIVDNKTFNDSVYHVHVRRPITIADAFKLDARELSLDDVLVVRQTG
jgi:hypothetical protein